MGAEGGLAELVGSPVSRSSSKVDNSFRRPCERSRITYVLDVVDVHILFSFLLSAGDVRCFT